MRRAEQSAAAKVGALFAGFFRRAKHRVVCVVDEGLVAFGRHRFRVVNRALDIVAPDLAR